ncbi:MAG: hypothetical protein J3Q66DRAFT_429854 [Benniella sp.]|nr:MAG: hypothetical protein J3Q66DRAFT_429854 [Benniella sp.]
MPPTTRQMKRAQQLEHNQPDTSLSLPSLETAQTVATCGENFPLEVAIAEEVQHQSSVAPSKRERKRARNDQDQLDKSSKPVQTSHSPQSLLPLAAAPSIQPISNETTGTNEDYRAPTDVNESHDDLEITGYSEPHADDWTEGTSYEYCPKPQAPQAEGLTEGIKHEFEEVLSPKTFVVSSTRGAVHIQSGPIRDMRTILETFLEEYIPSDRTHERDEVGYSTKMMRNEDFAYDIRDTLREDKGPIKEVIKSYRCSSCQCPVRTLRDLVKFGMKTYKRDVKFQHDKLELWLKALSSESPLVFCEILGDTNPQEDLSRILEQALVDSPASDDNVDRIRHIDIMESERVRVITTKDQLRETRDINELR